MAPAKAKGPAAVPEPQEAPPGTPGPAEHQPHPACSAPHWLHEATTLRLAQGSLGCAVEAPQVKGPVVQGWDLARQVPLVVGPEPHQQQASPSLFLRRPHEKELRASRQAMSAAATEAGAVQSARSKRGSRSGSGMATLETRPWPAAHARNLAQFAAVANVKMKPFITLEA